MHGWASIRALRGGGVCGAGLHAGRPHGAGLHAVGPHGAALCGGGGAERAGRNHARNDLRNSSSASVRAAAISSERAFDAASSVSTFGRSDSRNR